MSRIEETLKFHNKGFNCAQSVALPYCDLFGIDEKTVACAMEGFGAGMGGRQTTCGALSGAVMLAGLKYADGNLEAPKSKAETYKAVAKIVEEFKNYCGNINCCDIKSNDKVSCEECILQGARLVEEYLVK